MMHLDDLEKFFNKTTIPAVIQISGSEFVRDVPKMVSSHISTLRANPNNRTFLPYYNRLYNLYMKIK